MALARSLTMVHEQDSLGQLANPLCPSITSGILRYQDAERKWWKDYCEWRLNADARGRAALDSLWKRDDFGHLMPRSSEAARLTQAGKVGETKKRGTKQLLHRVENVPVLLNIEPPPMPPGAQGSQLETSDVEAITAARLVNGLCRDAVAAEGIGPSYARAVATAGGADWSLDADLLQKWRAEQKTLPKPIEVFPPREEQRRLTAELPVHRVYGQLASSLLFDPLTLISAMQTSRPAPPEQLVYLSNSVGGQPRRPTAMEVESRRVERDKHVQVIAWAVSELIISLRVLTRSAAPIWPAIDAAERAEAPLLLWERHDRYLVAESCALRGLLMLARELIGIATAPFHDPVHHECDVQLHPFLPPDFRIRALNSVHQAWFDASLGGGRDWDNLPTRSDLQTIEYALRAEQVRVLKEWNAAPKPIEFNEGDVEIRYEPGMQMVYVAGEAHWIEDQAAAKYFELVFRAKGAPVPGPEVERVTRRRPTRLKEKLPPAVRELIVIEPRKGTRMRAQAKVA